MKNAPFELELLPVSRAWSILILSTLFQSPLNGTAQINGKTLTYQVVETVFFLFCSESTLWLKKERGSCLESESDRRIETGGKIG